MIVGLACEAEILDVVLKFGAFVQGALLPILGTEGRLPMDRMQGGVKLRVGDLDDVELHLTPAELLEPGTQPVRFGSAAPDHHTGNDRSGRAGLASSRKPRSNRSSTAFQYRCNIQGIGSVGDA